MNELDFSGRQVLVAAAPAVSATARAGVRAKGARVAVCGTRAHAADYSAGEGSDLGGSNIRSSMCRTRRRSSNSSRHSKNSTCWCWRRRGDLPARRVRNGWFSQGARGQSDEPDGLCDEVSRDALGEQRLAHHRELHRGLSLDHGNPAYNASKTARWGSPRTLAKHGRSTASASTASRPFGRHQDDQGDDCQSEAARRRAGTNPAEASRHARRHGRRRAVPGLAALRPM